MKQFFTSLKLTLATVVLMLGVNAMADEISWAGQSDWDGIGSGEAGSVITLESGAYMVTAQKNSGTTNPTVNASAGDLRVYAKGTLTVSSTNTMTAIVFNISDQGKKRLTDITASTGSVVIDNNVWTVTWTGSASEVSFIVGDKATYGTEGDAKAGQFDISSPIQVTTEGGGVFVPAPVISPATGTFTEPVTVTISAQAGLTVMVSKQIGDLFTAYTAPFTVSEDATITTYAVDAKGNKSTTVSVAYTFVNAGDLTGDGTSTNPYTVADVHTLYATGSYTTDKVYVKGKISEIKSIDVSKYTRAQYYISDDGTTANQFYIYNGLYLNGEVFTANDQINVGDEVVVYGQLTIYGTTQEMAADNYLFKLNGEGGTVVEPDHYNTLNDAIGYADKTHDCYIDINEVYVQYINGSSVYVFEIGTSRGFLFYGTDGLPEGLKAGDVLQGTVFGQLKSYYGLPELVPVASGTELTVVENRSFTTPAYELSSMLVDSHMWASLLVKVEDFIISESTLTDKKVTINQYGDEAILFDQFQILTGVTFSTDTEYTATFITTVRDGVLQLYPVDKSEFDVEIDVPTYSSIAELKAAATADKAACAFKFTDLLVTYASGRYVYVTDGNEGFLFYASANTTLKAGDNISGDVSGTLWVRYGVPQFEYATTDESIIVNSHDNTVTPASCSIESLNTNATPFVSMLVKLDDIYFTASALDSRNVTIKQGDDELTLRDNFSLVSDVEFETDKPYDITAIVAIYANEAGTTVQVYPVDRDELTIYEPTYEFVGNGSFENPYTVADVQHLFDPDQASQPVWIKGIIIGCVNGSINMDKFANTEGDQNLVASNIMLADDATSIDLSKSIPVNLVYETVFRNDLNVKDHIDNVGKEVILHGTVEKYFSVAGVKNLDEAYFNGQYVGINIVQVARKILSGDIYTISGQKLGTVTRGGLYIIGGKKVLVK